MDEAGNPIPSPGDCPTRPTSHTCLTTSSEEWVAQVLGGAWQHDGRGSCLVVDRLYAGDRPHGKHEIGEWAEMLASQKGSLSAFAPAALRRDGQDLALPFSEDGVDGEARKEPDVGRLLFFDIETTGLSGGAGTCAFLLGFGWFEGTGFRTRQYFLGGFGHEAPMLRMAAEPLREEGVTLASFNGKTFDVPLMQGRYLFHRVPSPFDDIEHIDLLHPARRLWRHRPARPLHNQRERNDRFSSYFRGAAWKQDDEERRTSRSPRTPDYSSCALGVLEDAILGYRRTGDVPGSEIPSRYFHYARSGDPRQLQPVLEHNRLDLVSLAAVAAVVAQMLEEGPSATSNAHECLALGQVYERSGDQQAALECYERAVGGNRTDGWISDSRVEREALRRLAVSHRRKRRHDEAAAAWQRLLDLAAEADVSLEFEALHALAVHHEHRSRNLEAARDFVLRALEGCLSEVQQQDLKRRLERLNRKMSAR